MQGFPTIKLMYSLDGKVKSQDYNGGRTAKDIVNFAMDKAKALALKRIGAKPEAKPSGGGGGGGSGSRGGGGGEAAGVPLPACSVRKELWLRRGCNCLWLWPSALDWGCRVPHTPACCPGFAAGPRSLACVCLHV